MLCREFSLVKHFDGGMFALPLCCRSWGCEYCQPGRKREVTRAAAAGYPNTLITITVNPNEKTWPAWRARNLVKAWRAFVEEAKWLYQLKELPYFCVFEATKNGEPHLHILCRVDWIHQKFLSAFMKVWIGAPIVDIRRCNSGRSAARYVAKYIGKQPGKFGTCKRYWQTRSYQDKDAQDNEKKRQRSEGWELVEAPIGILVFRAKDQGYTLSRDGDVWTFKRSAPP